MTYTLPENRKPTKTDALLSLKPGADWVLRGDTLTWHSKDITQPTDSEINAEITRLQTEHDNNKYQRDRKPLYPSIEDQLDMQYWDKKNGTNKWVEAVDKVKSDNPKS